MTKTSEPPKAWTMEVSRVAVETAHQDGHDGIRLKGFIGDGAGVYVFIPLPEFSREQLATIAADMQNGLDSMLYLFNEPESARRDGMIDEAAERQIRAWKAGHHVH